MRTVPCCITSQHERKNSSRLTWYFSNVLRPSSIKVSKVGLRMLPLSRTDSLLPEFPPFMFDVLEVVDCPAELPKCVATQIVQEPKARGRNCRNRTIRIGKPNCPVLSILTVISGTAGTRRWSFSSGQATSGRKIVKNHDILMG
jgi:hypothetical protein